MFVIYFANSVNKINNKHFINSNGKMNVNSRKTYLHNNVVMILMRSDNSKFSDGR